MSRNFIRTAGFFSALMLVSGALYAEPATADVENSAASESTSRQNDEVQSEGDSQTEEGAIEAVRERENEREAQMEAMRELSRNFPSSEAQSVKGVGASKRITQKALPAPRATERMPVFEHHGYFRTRLNYLGNYDLDTRGTSPVAAPIGARERGADQQIYVKGKTQNHLFGGDMRFRYLPTIHLGEAFRIRAAADVMDNAALGSTSANAATGWGRHTIHSFDGASTFGASSAISVKSLYAEADTILGSFRLGRMPLDWGLGIIYNDGGSYREERRRTNGKGWNGIEADASDNGDRVLYMLRDPFFNLFYFSFAWDFSNSGISSKYKTQDNFAAAFDLSESDDVIQFEFSLFDRPITQKESDYRRYMLSEEGNGTYDWGLLFSYREQKTAPDPSDLSQGSGESSLYQIYTRKAELFVLDAWGRAMWTFPNDILFRLEAELVGAFGSIRYDKAISGKKRDIVQVGLATESEIRWKTLSTGMKTGFAWSKNAKYAGHPMLDKDPNVPEGSNFRFDSSYHVDRIMYRTLMGGVGNSWYLNLFAEYGFPIDLSANTLSLGGKIDITTSVALNRNATPGLTRWYGAETTIGLFYEEIDLFRVDILAGFFVPGGAWDRLKGSFYPVLPSSSVYTDDINASENYRAKVAWTVQTHAVWMF